jgi:NAD(P)H-hydrate epimerase
VTGLYAVVIQHFSQVRAPIVAVDIPSGLDADAMDGAPPGPVVPACATVTFTAPRPAHVFSPLVKGPVAVAPIGSPEEAIQSALNLELITPRAIREMVAPRPRDSHKGMYGHVLVIGGSVGKAGAAGMAGMAALRAGAGLATVATAQSVLPTVAGFAPELMTEPLPETEAGTISLRARGDGRLDGIIKGKTVLAIGPGISQQTETSELVRLLVKATTVPIVLDADGLNAFEGRAQELTGHPLVITPHPGEMSRLAQLSTKQIQENRLHVARDFATRYRITTVLKGHRTLIAQADGKVWVNPTGNPGMASGGMGDILTGLVAGMLAQTTHSVTAVLAAVYLHGLAGDVACKKMGEHSLIATDLLAALPEAFRRVREEAAKPAVRFTA